MNKHYHLRKNIHAGSMEFRLFILGSHSLVICPTWTERPRNDLGEGGGGGVRVCLSSSRHFDGLVQERRKASALAMELRLSCTKPSIFTC